MSSFLSKRLALAVISIVSAPVGAATVFEVNTFQDGADISQGGTCATATGACSLRAAIQEANFQASTGPHTIKLPAGTYALSLQGLDDSAAMGDLDINSSMTIEGFGADKTIIQLASSVVNTEYRIFHIVATSGSPTVTIKGVTIKGGMSSLGAGIYLQTGTLNLNDSQIDSNNANQGSGALGGGVYSNGTLKLSGSTISNNTVANNNFGQGGGIYVTGSAQATYITNSTISTNTVSGLQGGGIFNASAGTFAIASSTITQNAVNSSGTGGSGIFNAATSANVRLKNTILAQNRSNGGSSIPDCSGPLASDGYNLVGLASGGGVCTFGSVNGDQVGPVSGVALSAGLGNLALNGGSVMNHLPGFGSLTIESGSPAGCTSVESVALTTDQRGYVRASLSSGASPGLQGRCDIGAVEYNSSYSAMSSGVAGAPVATAMSITAYTYVPSGGGSGINYQVSGSLAGANSAVPATGTSVVFTGLTYGLDTTITPRGVAGINTLTGYFSYTPPSGGTGTDMFRYYVDNGSTRVTADVTVNLINSAPSQQNPPTGASAVNVNAQQGYKLRGSLAFADPDLPNIKFNASVLTQGQKGVVTVDTTDYVPFYEYTLTQTGATGTDSFQISVADAGGRASVFTVNVSIGSGGTITSTALVALGALIREDVSRAQTTSLSDFSSVLRNPSNVVVTLAKSTDSVGSTGALLGTVAYSNGVFTFTPPVGGVSAADNRASFRINGTYSEAGTLRTLPEVTVTLNFAVAGASTIPVPNQFSSPATVPRTSGGTFSSATASPLLTSITLPSGATSIVFDVSNSASGTFGNSASSSLGRVDVSTPSNGAFLYTVTSGTAVTANQDTFYYRVRYTDSLGNPVTTTSAVMFLNFIGAPAAPVATAFSATAVPRTGIFSPLQNLSTYVTGLASGVIPTIEVYSSASGWSVLGASSPSVVGFYGTLTIMNSQLGTFTYTPNASLTSIATSDQFQYRARYNDGVGGTTTTSPATLTLNFVSAALPVAHGHTVVVSSSTSTRVDLAGSPVVPGAALQYILVTPPTNGDLYDANGTTMIMVNAPFSSAILQYRPKNNGATGDTFVFKVREGTVDSLNATMPLTYSSSVAPTPLEEGGGGALSPLALLAMLALYGRRRLR